MRPLSRRAALRGIGGTLIALPALEAMGAAATSGPKRFVVFVTYNGSVHDKWVPTTDASGTIQKMSPMLAPLEPFKSKLLMVSGVDLVSCDADPALMDGGHIKPKVHMLTGKFGIGGSSSSGYGDVGGISIDQQIAKQIAPARYASLQFGVQVSQFPIGSLGPKTYVPPMNDPQAAFKKVFTGVSANAQLGPDPTLVRLRKRRQSVLDYVRSDYDRVSGRLGAADRARLDQHLASIRELERSLAALATGTVAAGCAPPDVSKAPVDKTTFVAGPQADFLPIGQAHMDLLAASLTCDLTRVATIQWSGNGVYSPWLGPTFTKDHHGLSHENQAAIETIQNWYAGHFAYLLGKLDSVREGNGTVLDNTVVVWLSEIGHGFHTHYDIPYLLAGSCGGYFKTGRHVDFNPAPGAHDIINGTRKAPHGPAHNNLLLSFLEAMGLDATSFGEAQFCKGPLALR